MSLQCRRLWAALGPLLLLSLWTALGRCQETPSCQDSFDIHQDKIIRTQDSRAMGARYLNERDVPSREDCLRLCCDTPDCDVFVFEEKTPGSCYLFQCGTPEDFKCKFTRHRNYTSAVLVVNRHLTELESQIKHTQHEQELTKLRKPDKETVSPAAIVTHTTSSPSNKEVAHVIPTFPAVAQGGRCSRYQFECRGSGECIAVYNACDGIPQCSDGSDEAPELGCPAQGSTAVPAPKAGSAVESPGVRSGSGTSPQQFGGARQSPLRPDTPSPLAEDPALVKQFKASQWPQQNIYESAGQQAAGAYLHVPGAQQLEMQQPALPQQYPPSPPQLISQAKQFGREGEGLLYHPQWPPGYQPDQMGYHSPNSGGSQIFSHKGSGLVAHSQQDRYKHAHGNRVVGEGGVTGQFDPMQAEYNRYNNYYENPPYHKQPQGPGNWQLMHKPHDMSNVPGLEENMNMNMAVANMPQTMPGQDYYYEENFRTRLQPQMITQRLSPPNNIPPLPQEPVIAKVQVKSIQKGEAEVENQEMLAVADSKSASSNTSVKKASTPNSVASNTTEKPKESHHHAEHHHNSHRKVETLSAELSLTENSFDSDDGQNVNPRGAILSLTMGLCVTGIMLVLVGCRMRMVRRRMRRGSKSPYAHDADFLVNGMYL